MPAGPDLKVKRAVNPGRGAKTKVNRGPGRPDTPETPPSASQPPGNPRSRSRPPQGATPCAPSHLSFSVPNIEAKYSAIFTRTLQLCLPLRHFRCFRALGSVVRRCLPTQHALRNCLLRLRVGGPRPPRKITTRSSLKAHACSLAAPPKDYKPQRHLRYLVQTSGVESGKGFQGEEVDSAGAWLFAIPASVTGGQGSAAAVQTRRTTRPQRNYELGAGV